jgi:SAM-dependent methyltransferase
MKHLVKFQVPPLDESLYWRGVHEAGYESVFSVTQDSALLAQIIEIVVRKKSAEVLIPGCGTFTHLQEALLGLGGSPVSSLVCTDFEHVTSLVRPRLQSSIVQFLGCQTQDLPFACKFDTAIVVNSIVSANDELNRLTIKRIVSALKPGGRLIALFPTVFDDIDLTSLGHENQPVIDVPRNLIFESTQGVWQLAYSPLRLRLILKEAGLEVSEMRVVFLDSDDMLRRTREYYGIKDSDLPIWELLVEATKPE